MPSVKDYQEKLQSLDDWEPYLLKNSGLPGPRGNLELAQAAAELADQARIDHLLSVPPEKAPENSANVFLVFCGITALGKMAARGGLQNLQKLRPYASDGRWRVREAVAIALQYLGDADMPALLREMKTWVGGNWFEKRAVAAALAEPRLLKDSVAAEDVLRIMDGITQDIASAKKPPSESFRALRQSMGYCWSVAVSAHPGEGKRLMEQWMVSTNADVRWIMKENLKKNRLSRMDPKWTEKWKLKMGKTAR
jgi:hypothetical protein